MVSNWVIYYPIYKTSWDIQVVGGWTNPLEICMYANVNLDHVSKWGETNMETTFAPNSFVCGTTS